jgi:hypothetical protein
MKNFELTSDMLTMSGVFYPKGYIFIMFPDEKDAQQVAHEIDADRVNGGETMVLTPATVLRDIGKVDGESDLALPSIGTESATVAKYIELARDGQYAVMVKVKSDEQAASVISAAQKVPFSYGQRYHLLAMEDIEHD